MAFPWNNTTFIKSKASQTYTIVLDNGAIYSFTNNFLYKLLPLIFVVGQCLRVTRYYPLSF